MAPIFFLRSRSINRKMNMSPSTNPSPSQGEPHDPPEDLALIARTLEVVGDAWTLLIVREALAGTTRFSQFQRQLGVGPSILAARLRALMDHGVMEARASTQRADWHDYVLTDKGVRLQTVLAALRQWGGDHCAVGGLAHVWMPEVALARE